MALLLTPPTVTRRCPKEWRHWGPARTLLVALQTCRRREDGRLNVDGAGNLRPRRNSFRYWFTGAGAAGLGAMPVMLAGGTFNGERIPVAWDPPTVTTTLPEGAPGWNLERKLWGGRSNLRVARFRFENVIGVGPEVSSKCFRCGPRVVATPEVGLRLVWAER